MDKIKKLAGTDKIIKTGRLFRALLTSLAVYYAFCIKVEELFWLLFGMTICMYHGLGKADGHREKERRQRIVFGMLGCYASLCLTLGLCYYEGMQHSAAQWIIIFSGLFLLFYEAEGYLYHLWSGLSLKPFVIGVRWTKWRRVLGIALLLFAGWIPMLLANYPGILMYDSTEQWYQAVGEWGGGGATITRYGIRC